MSFTQLPTQFEVQVRDAMTNVPLTNDKDVFLCKIRKAAAAGVIPLAGVKHSEQQPFFGQEAHEKLALNWEELKNNLSSDEGYLIAPAIGAIAGGAAGLGLEGAKRLVGKPSRKSIWQAMLKGGLVGGGLGLAGKALTSGAANLTKDEVQGKSETPSQDDKGLQLSAGGAAAGGAVGLASSRMQGIRGGKSQALVNSLEGKGIAKSDINNKTIGFAGNNGVGTQHTGTFRNQESALKRQVKDVGAKNIWDFITGKSKLENLKQLAGNQYDTLDQKSRNREIFKDLTSNKSNIAKGLAKQVAGAANPEAEIKKALDQLLKTNPKLHAQVVAATKSRLGGSAFETLSPEAQRQAVQRLAGNRAAIRFAAEGGGGFKGLLARRPVGTIRTAGGAAIGAAATPALESLGARLGKWLDARNQEAQSETFKFR